MIDDLFIAGELSVNRTEIGSISRGAIENVTIKPDSISSNIEFVPFNREYIIQVLERMRDFDVVYIAIPHGITSDWKLHRVLMAKADESLNAWVLGQVVEDVE